MEFPYLKHPFSMLICGPSNSGKTYFVKRLIEEELIVPMPSKIIWCYGAYQKLFSELPSVEFYEGLPQDVQHVSNALIIIDDLMSELANDSNLSKLFTKGSHHRNLSVIFIVQNIFHQGKEMRNISLNTSYMALFKNVRDKQQIACLARQMFPEDPKFFMESYNIATTEPYGYLFLDLKPDTDDRLRLRAGIFPSDKLNSAFLPQQHPYVRWFDTSAYDPDKLLEYMKAYDTWQAQHSSKPFIPIFKPKDVNTYNHVLEQQAVAVNKPYIKEPDSHINKQKGYPCSKCSAAFTYQHDLRRHQSSKHEEIAYTCNICQKVFTRKDVMTRHMSSHN